MRRASGKPTAITCTATRGASSGTAATELAARPGGRARPGDTARAKRGPRRAGLAGAPGRAARGRASDRRGWLPGAAELLDRVTARRQGEIGADRRTLG